MKIRYRVNGVELTQEEFQALPSYGGEMLASGEPPMTVRDFRNPVDSYQLAVHPDQSKEAQDHSILMGVPTEFREGTPHFETKQQLRAYNKAYGFRRREKGEGVKSIDIDKTCAEYGIENPGKRKKKK